MAINNLNPRRTVWFSPYEPLNKYDIWLSKNAHYDENGESTTDSDAQRDCDYIFKIYDCGKWQPIVGFNTTAAHKIDTVDGASYTPTGSTTPKVSKHEFHPAIFTKETPAELFDYGTVAEVLEGLVNENEWQSIINNGGLGDAIEYYIGNGDIEIPFATTTKIGGIYSDTQENLLDVHNKFKGVECAFYPNYQQYAALQHRLCVNAYDMKQAFNDIDRDLYDEDPTSELIVNGWKGIVTQMREGHNGVWVGIDGVNSNNSSKIPIVNKKGDGIEWVNMSVVSPYTGGNGINVNNNIISQNIQYCKKGTITSQLTVISMSVSDTYNIVIASTDNGTATQIREYEVFDESDQHDYVFDLSYGSPTVETSTNPIYLKINADTITIADGTKYICDSLVDNAIPSGEYLVTIQFGIIKFEKINTYSNA